MNVYTLTSLLALLLSSGAGALIFLKNPKHTLNRVFAVGLMSLLLIEFGVFMVFLVEPGSKALLWGRVALIGLCFFPANWTLFSLVFARENFQELLQKWKGYLILLYLIGAFFLLFVPSQRFITLPQSSSAKDIFWLGAIGRYFLIYFLLSTVVILVNLENTLRATKSENRKVIRMPVLGLMGAFLFCIYATSQMLMFSRVGRGLPLIGSLLLILNCILFFYYALRYRLMQVEVYIGRQAVYSSAMVLMVGIYLLIVGIIAKIVQITGGNLNIFLSVLSAFAVIFMLRKIWVSESLKKKLKAFIDRNFYKGKYDYRYEWGRFSNNVSSISDLQELLGAIIETTTSIMFVQKASILLEDESSHGFTIAKVKNLPNVNELFIPSESGFMNWLCKFGKPVEMSELSQQSDTAEFYNQNRETFAKLESVVWVPMIIKRKLIGILTLGKKSTNNGYTNEDFELLETIANQSSIAIMNTKLNEQLIASRELESFHRFSSFVVHDLRNSVSVLSMITNNARTNIENPEFQKNMLATISDVIERMKGLMSKISTVPNKMGLNLQPVHINSLVREVVEECKVRNSSQINVEEKFGDIPVSISDPEQIQRVITNLIVNAIEAMPQGGNLILSTRMSNAKDPSLPAHTEGSLNEKYIEIEVSDNGMGMSSDFIKHKLFKPFQTTKSDGLGIGLYHCREIVAAHGGQIRVQSQEGKGTTFLVQLPLEPKLEDLIYGNDRFQ